MDKEDRGFIIKQFEQWVKANVAFPDLDLHGKCNKLRLTHLSVDRKPQGDVHTFAVKLEEGAESEIDPLLIQIADYAQRDCDDLNQGLQSYALYAYYPSDQNYVPRKVFRVSPSDVDVDRDVTPSEPANEKGLVAQTMRHLEAVMRTTAVTNTSLIQTLQNELSRMATMNEKFSQQQVDFMILLQDLVDRSHARRLNEKSKEASLAMQESALSKLEALLPVIINRIAGKPILPEEDKSFMLTASLLEGLTTEQQQQLYGLLTDTQRIVLAEMLEAYETKKSKVLQRDAQLILGAKNKLPPATGDKKNTQGDPAPVDVATVPLPTTLNVKDRLALSPESSSDPQIQKLEADAAAFKSRFADMLRPKPTTGD